MTLSLYELVGDDHFDDEHAKFFISKDFFVFCLTSFKQYKYALSSVLLFNKISNTNETPIKRVPIPLKYFGLLFKFEKIAVRKNKYAQKLVLDGCAKINTRKINQCAMREIKSARKLARTR